MIRFRVTGTPKGQPRPRAFAKKLNDGRVLTRMYEAGTAEEWKGQVALAARPFLPTAPIEGPVQIDVTFIFPRPKYLLTKKSPMGRIPHTAKPDRDNLDKAVLDALKTLGFVRDDSQVYGGLLEKVYAAKDETAGAEVTIRTEAA